MQNLQNSFIKLLIILIVSVVSVFFVGICIGFLSDTLSLKSDQYDVILTFVGIIGTFVVISNFHQVEEIKQENANQIIEFEKSFQDKIKILEKRHAIVEHLLLSTPEYKIAQKVVEQNKLNDVTKKETFTITIHAKHIQSSDDSKWCQDVNVKIKNLSFNEEELAWEFLNYANKDYPVDDIDILYIKMGDILEGVEECSFYNPNFITILKYLLSKEND